MVRVPSPSTMSCGAIFGIFKCLKRSALPSKWKIATTPRTVSFGVGAGIKLRILLPLAELK